MVLVLYRSRRIGKQMTIPGHDEEEAVLGAIAKKRMIYQEIRIGADDE